MNPIIQEIFEKRTTQSVDGKTVNVLGQISAQEGELIRRCIEEIKAEVSVEVGLAFGTSAMFICEYLKKTPNTRHYVMDPFQMYDASYGGIGLNNLKKSGYGDFVEFMDKPSQLALPELEQRKVIVDFAFIDGWHTFDHTLVDFFFTDRILKKGGIIILDDTDWPAVKKLVSFINTNRSYEFIEGTPPRTFKKKSSENKGSPFTALKSILSNDTETETTYGAMAFRKVSDDIRSWDHYNEFP